MKKLILLGLLASLCINPVMSEDDSSKSKSSKDEPGFVDSGWDQEDKRDVEERKDYDESEDEEDEAPPPPTPAANEESGQFIDSGWDEEDRKDSENEKRDTSEEE
jgi:hypothetical protein